MKFLKVFKVTLNIRAMTSKQQQFAVGKSRILENTYDFNVQKKMLEPELLTKVDEHLNLLKSPPFVLAEQYSSLIDIVIKSQDPDRIVWLSRKLKSIYLGAEFQPYLPYDWEDEAILYHLSR